MAAVLAVAVPAVAVVVLGKQELIIFAVVMKRLILFVASALLLLPAAGAQEPPKMNKKNLVIKEWNSDPKGGNKVLDHITTFSAEGKKIEEAEYGSDGSVDADAPVPDRDVDFFLFHFI